MLFLLGSSILHAFRFSQVSITFWDSQTEHAGLRLIHLDVVNERVGFTWCSAGVDK